MHLELRDSAGQVAAQWDWPYQSSNLEYSRIVAARDAVWVIHATGGQGSTFLLRFDLATGKWWSMATPVTAVWNLLIDGDSAWVGGGNGLGRVRLTDYAEGGRLLRARD